MVLILALRHLWVRKLRALFLLFGYGLGVGVMIVLLSVGQAMLEQSRDVSLVGGGAITVLPEGIDIEAMRTGGLSGMFFSIDRARFVARQLLGGLRHRGMIAAVSPEIIRKLVYLQRGDRMVAARAYGDIPSRAAAVGAPAALMEGRWTDTPADSAYILPTAEELYHEIDRFHANPGHDSSWGEWHYVNLVTAPDEWWYLSLLVGGEVPWGRWGGRVLVSHRRPDGRYEQFQSRAPGADCRIDTLGADVTVGSSTLRQRAGAYRLSVHANGADGTLLVDLAIRPDANRYFPAVTLQEGDSPSGYVAPALSARATGRICVKGRCTLVDAPAYHDHNWGTWRDVTWDWGAATGSWSNVLYGALHSPSSTGRAEIPPFFVAVVDSLGVRQILRAREIRYGDQRPVGSVAGVSTPRAFTLTAGREADTVHLRVNVTDVQATEMGAAGFRRYFLQLRGRFSLEGRLAGREVADSGTGFFETYAGAGHERGN